MTELENHCFAGTLILFQATSMNAKTSRWKFAEKHDIYRLPRWCSGKEFTCQCRRCKKWGFNPWVRKIPWRRKCNPLQYSCLENSMNRGGWRATIHGVAKSQRWLSNWAPMHHLTLIRMAIIKKSRNRKCWRGRGEKGNLLCSWWECKLVKLLWRTVWKFL